MISPSLEGVTHHYSRHHRAAIQDVSFGVQAGEVFCILGPSGSGKTTILKLFAGLIRPEIGRVLFDARDVSSVAPESRDAVMVFQNPLLFPFMTVGENVAFGLRMSQMPRDERDARVHETLEYVRLGGYAGRRVHQLSGGQKQRVALARALALRPGLLLLDEPLSNLDEHLRDEMRDLICSTRATYDTTVVIVTHDRHDAAILSDRIAVVLDGRVRQVGRYEQMLSAPASREVGEFLGNRNWIAGVKRGSEIETPLGRLTLPERRSPATDNPTAGLENLAAEGPAPGTPAPDGDVWVSIRPEHLYLGRNGHLSVRGEVSRAVAFGSHGECRVRIGDIELGVSLPPGMPLPRGRAEVSFDPANAIILPR
jgi:ABC-type Fe3+/spermidine/putrescine transport system ATPase subunit